MKCNTCYEILVKYGKQANGKQRYYCKSCKSSCQDEYTYLAYYRGVNKNIYRLLCEGVGIRGIARLMGGGHIRDKEQI